MASILNFVSIEGAIALSLSFAYAVLFAPDLGELVSVYGLGGYLVLGAYFLGFPLVFFVSWGILMLLRRR